MRRFYLSCLIGFVTLDVCALMVIGQVQSLGDAASCDTLYIGPPDGDWRLAANWSPVIPGADDVACFPGQAMADSVNLPGNLTVRISAASSGRRSTGSRLRSAGDAMDSRMVMRVFCRPMCSGRSETSKFHELLKQV